MKYAFVMFFTLCLFLYTSCTKEVASELPCAERENISFSNDIIPLFNVHCNTAGCHSGANPEGGLNLEPAQAYDQLMQAGSGYIDTVTPHYSLLYAQMNSVSNPMPPDGKLDKCDIAMVLKWIEQKAKNN